MLATALGLMVSKEALLFSYVTTFAVIMSVMTNACQHFIRNSPAQASCGARWAPSLLMITATVLLLLAPLKNLVVNVCMASFRQNGFDSTIERSLDVAYLPVFSTRCMQVYTCLAYVCMLWATALQVDIGTKFHASLKASRLRYSKGFSQEGGCADGS